MEGTGDMDDIVDENVRGNGLSLLQVGYTWNIPIHNPRGFKSANSISCRPGGVLPRGQIWRGSAE